jgi:hypothetical protein
MRRFLVVVSAGLCTVLGVGACGSNDNATKSTRAGSSATSTAAASPTTSNPYGVPSIDPPAPNEPVLTVTGGTTPLSLTLDQLNALGSTTVTIDEPFVKQRQTFSGVPLGAVLAKAGIPETATIDTVALNAYHYTSAAKPMIDSKALIATARDNAPIPYDQGGPIRIVFPDGTPLSSVLDAWNWSVATINVTGAGSG